MTTAPAILYGCADDECGYTTVPSTMGTPYARCPLCGGPWVVNPPPQLKTTGKTIQHLDASGKVRSQTVVRPHLQQAFLRLEAEQKK